MDRRAFMMTSAWLTTAAGGAWPWLAQPGASGETFAIADSTLPFSAAFARYAVAMNVPTFDTGNDIGVLWHTTLLPLLSALANPGGISWRRPWLIGVTRASDYFVLKELATRTTHRLEHSHEQDARSAPVSFVFAPR
ncbi:hypothetical protein VOM14_08280 [Paraburkholderia sp. MPAMCS5]|uniref:hypothetical protein n=1 Tax=Paraburkholderia sp. MPAMCS5 TaxID=3112563 RepID=UPI002E19B2F8|nr:hypothetical protein [Paraburkholderia sp. MPAMCS5]